MFAVREDFEQAPGLRPPTASELYHCGCHRRWSIGCSLSFCLPAHVVVVCSSFGPESSRGIPGRALYAGACPGRHRGCGGDAFSRPASRALRDA
eukprot:4928093-Pyramimonas_sp.AAC.1